MSGLLGLLDARPAPNQRLRTINEITALFCSARGMPYQYDDTKHVGIFGYALFFQSDQTKVKQQVKGDKREYCTYPVRLGCVKLKACYSVVLWLGTKGITPIIRPCFALSSLLNYRPTSRTE